MTTSNVYSLRTGKPVETVVAIRARERTDLGCYRASLHYNDLRLMLVRALSAATLGDDPVASARAVTFMRHVAEFSEDFPQARGLAREYLGYVGRQVSRSAPL